MPFDSGTQAPRHPPATPTHLNHQVHYSLSQSSWWRPLAAPPAGAPLLIAQHKGRRGTPSPCSLPGINQATEDQGLIREGGRRRACAATSEHGCCCAPGGAPIEQQGQQ